MNPRKFTTKALIVTILMSLFAGNTNAQILKKLKNKVKEKTEQKAEDETERKTDEVLDSILGKKKKKKKGKNAGDVSEDAEETAGMEMMSGILGGGDVEYESSYQFLVTATMEVTDYTKRKETARMEQSYGKKAIMSTIEDSPMPIIIDMENNAALMIDNSENSIQVMSLAWMQKMMGGADIDYEKADAATVNKTGNTKVINGYTCHEYNITYENTKVNAWFAPDVDFSYQDYLRGFSKMFAGKKANNPAQLLNEGYGYVMEMTAYKKGEKINELRVTKINTTPITIDTANYTIQKMF